MQAPVDACVLIRLLEVDVSRVERIGTKVIAAVFAQFRCGDFVLLGMFLTTKTPATASQRV